MNFPNWFKKEQLAEKPKRRAMTAEIGAGGIAFYSGILKSDEFNDLLTGRSGIEIYDKMRRSDAQVAALVNTCTLPLLSAHWDVDYPDNPTERKKVKKEHLEFAQENLFERVDFQSFLRHVTSSLWAGFSWIEIIYGIDGEYFVLKKLAPRLASTVEKWLVDKNGNLEGIQQRIQTGLRTEYVDIPRHKLALFTYAQEADNYEGTSLLRAVYKPWSVKDMMYKFDAIRAERFAVGVPVITLPPDSTDDLYDMADTIVQQWRGAEQSGVVVPTGMTIDILSMKGGEVLDLLASINHHNQEIAKVGLAQFINLGQTQTGSRALGEVSTEFFYDAEEGWARSIASIITRDILWPLMDRNFPGKIRPKVVVSDLGAVGLQELVNTLKEAGGYIKPAMDIENALRDRMNLSPVEEDEYGKEMPPEVPEEVDEGDEEEPEEEIEAHVHLIAAPDESEFWRPLTPAEQHCSLRQMSGMIDDSRDRLMRVLLGYRAQWLKLLGDQVLERIAQGPKALESLSIPIGDTNVLLALLADVYDYGYGQVYREIRSQQDARENLRDTPPTEEEIDELLDARAFLMLSYLARKTQEAVVTMALSMYRTISPADFTQSDVERLLGLVAESTELEVRLAARQSVTESLNMGRDKAARALYNDIRTCQYSAIMDRNTCGNCRDAERGAADVPLFSQRYYDLMPPLNSKEYGPCDGRSNCRCIWVYILKDESNA